MLKRIVCALFFISLAATAWAKAPEFKSVDLDKDGNITQTEATAAGMQEEMFTQLDVNKDGMLDMEEYEALMKQGG